MDRYTLPTSVTIAGNEVEINSDFRDIIRIFTMFNDPDLLSEEKGMIALDMFYKTDDYIKDMETALSEMQLFFNGGNPQDKHASTNEQPLYSWEQDFNLIVAPINRVMGTDVRGLPYLHWWTFLSAFMEIGECTFNTYVGIRSKLNKHKKLEKYEEQILKENRDAIILKKKYDATTQALMDEILGY